MKIIPELRNVTSNSNAELRLASLLSEIPGGDEDFAYHSFALNKHEYKKMSEIDFVVVFNGSVIIIEVKGGLVQRENGLWKFTNRYNQSNVKSEGPWGQARSAMFAFQKKMNELLPTESMNYTYMVATPDSDLSIDIEHEAWQWLGPRDMTPEGIRRKLEAASKEARRIVGKQAQSGSQFRKPNKSSLDKLRRLLSQKIDGKVPLNDYIVGFNHERLHLTDRQLRTVQKLASVPRVTISGGAGTGKTIIAVECAKQEALQGSQVAFVCQSDGVRAKVSRALQEFDIDVVNISSLGRSETLYDILVIDEGQDLINESDIGVLDGSLRGGFLDGRWWMFLDENNQVLEQDKFDRGVFSDYVVANSLRWPLDENLRNTKSIVTFVETHLAADIGDPSVQIHGPSSRMRELKSNSAATLHSQLVDEITRLVERDNIRPDDIWIISCKESVNDSKIESMLTQGWLQAPVPGGRVKVVTSREVKGLEIPVALVIDVEELTPSELSKIYVAFTRASIYMCAYAGSNAVGEMTRNVIKAATKERV